MKKRIVYKRRCFQIERFSLKKNYGGMAMKKEIMNELMMENDIFNLEGFIVLCCKNTNDMITFNSGKLYLTLAKSSFTVPLIQFPTAIMVNYDLISHTGVESEGSVSFVLKDNGNFNLRYKSEDKNLISQFMTASYMRIYSIFFDLDMTYDMHAVFRRS